MEGNNTETESKISELQSYINSQQSSNTDIGACRRLSNNVYQWCTNQFQSEDIDLRQGFFNGEAGTAEHFYVILEHQNDNFILDPTVTQFTYQNWVDGKADTYVPKEEIPTIGLIDSSMTIFDRYS